MDSSAAPHPLDAARRPLMILGVGLVAFALLLDVFGITSTGISRGQMLLIVLGLAIVAVGMLGRRALSLYQMIGMALVGLIVLLLLIELASAVISGLIGDDQSAPTPDFPLPGSIAADYLDRDPWQNAIISEQETLGDLLEYAPYTVWTHSAFDGQFTHIDVNGVRQTPGAACGDESLTVYVFGASALWGLHARDEQTIPAALQRELGDSACVVNFAVWDFVSTQELLLLARQLQAGGRPDLVIFFNGVNDILSAYHTGRADVHPHLDQIAGLFDHPRGHSPPLQELLLDELEESTNTVPLFQRVLDDDDNAQTVNYRTLGIDADQLGAEVARRYLGNLRVLEALATGYGFEVRVFWQPIIVLGDKPLTDDEATLRASLDPAFVELAAVVYQDVFSARNPNPNLVDLSGIFDGDSALRWFDGVHVFPEVNAVIAAEMLRYIDSE
jgi:hypothetical protein